MPTFDLGKIVGPKGEQGIQGAQGQRGIQGIQGEKGDQGIQGMQGVQGEKGEQGIPGNDGYTPNIQVGETATLVAGSDATVKRRTGSPDSAPIFDFGIPRGADALDPGDMKKSIYDPTGKAQDIFAYADKNIKKAGDEFTGVVRGVSPVVGTVGGFRNIYFGKGAPAPDLGTNGDVYFDIQ